MSDSLSEASKAIVGALTEALSEPHMGIKLPRVLIVPLAIYLHTTLKMVAVSYTHLRAHET